ncbi:hypothetical protein J4H92_07795 [Leucobacter weissii]|uniref:Uncharacterized protein n=1 Tax=Leucobacter weissii TaxID=1983706 RepID=A0A939MJF4_9MICO|nr:hypothetical protein [Leucobacter weissii]MBO1901853.1 hypothetical protein [Leucobacter weissii]
MSRGVRKTFWSVFSALLVVALLAGAGLAYLNRQHISDHFAAQSFDAPQEVLDLADRLDLTDEGRRVFLATRPTLEASQRFNEQCADVDHSEGGHILGCYTRDSIHLFEVTDERIDGIVEVTAAHELLHATFARLERGERDDLAARLNELYAELSGESPALAERMSVYSALSGDGFANELHSVLGTEVRELPDWLEQHYARWFNDRDAIVDFFDDYHEIFDEIQTRAEELQTEMEELREDVEERSAAYEEAVERFNDQVDDFNRRNAAFEFSGNEVEFWELRERLERRSEELGNEYERIQRRIEKYEEMREELQDLDAVNQELNEKLDSQLAPPVGPSG